MNSAGLLLLFSMSFIAVLANANFQASDPDNDGVDRQD